ncbi:MAG: TatD family hydrolase [Bacillota bacterium]
MFNTPHLVDCHLHLQDPVLAAELPAVLDRARAGGVRRLVCNGTSEADWPRVAELAKAHPQVVACFGLHPWYAAGRSGRWLENLKQFLDAMPSGVGEIGLDRWIEPRDESAQEEVFRAQLGLARERGRPVMIHCLWAWGWLMDVLEDEEPLGAGMLIHAYGGSVDLIKPLAARGAYFSFAGNVLEERKAKGREALRAVPLDRLLVETDSPDMLPPGAYRRFSIRAADGKEYNEPGNLPEVLRGIAQVRGESEERLAEVIWGNAERLLGGVVHEG